MPDVGFGRTDGTILAFQRVLSVCLCQSPDLHGVSQLGSGPVGFHITDGFRIHARLLNRLGDDRGMGVGIGNVISEGLSAVIDGGASDHAVYPVPVPDGLVKGSEQDGPHTFSRDKAVRGGSECVASSAGGEHTHLAELDVFDRVEIEIHAASEGQVAFPISEAFAGQVDGVEGCGAGGVHRQARAFEIEEIGDPVGNGPRNGRRNISSRKLYFRSPQQICVGCHAGKHADPRLPEAPSCIACIFQGMPCNF